MVNYPLFPPQNEDVVGLARTWWHLRQAAAGNGVLIDSNDPTGMKVTRASASSINVAAGHYANRGIWKAYAGASPAIESIPAASAGYHRYDSICVKLSDNTIVRVAGIEAVPDDADDFLENFTPLPADLNSTDYIELAVICVDEDGIRSTDNGTYSTGGVCDTRPPFVFGLDDSTLKISADGKLEVQDLYPLRSTLTTRGDLYQRGEAGIGRLAKGAANTVLAAGANEWEAKTLTALLDTIGSTPGMGLMRGAAAWEARPPMPSQADVVIFTSGGNTIAMTRFGDTISSLATSNANNSTVIAAAIATLSSGQSIAILSNLTIGSSITFTDLSYIKFYNYGTITAGAGLTGPIIQFVAGSHGSGSWSYNRQHVVQLGRIDGNSRAAHGILVQDAYAVVIRDFDIINCNYGIEIKNVHSWSEACVVEHGCLTDCNQAMRFTPASGGTGTWSQVNTAISNVFVNLGIANSYGIYMGNVDWSNSVATNIRIWAHLSTITDIYVAGTCRAALFQSVALENFSGANQVGINFASTYAGGIDLSGIYHYSAAGIIQIVNTPVTQFGYKKFATDSNWAATVSADGTYVIEQGNSISGIYLIQWTSSDRDHKWIFAAMGTQYGSTGVLAKLAEEYYNSQKVLNPVVISKSADGTTLYLCITVANRNGDGTLAVTRIAQGGIGSHPKITLTSRPGSTSDIATLNST